MGEDFWEDFLVTGSGFPSFVACVAFMLPHLNLVDKGTQGPVTVSAVSLADTMP